MKLENYLMSDAKWNDKDGIVAELEKQRRVDWEQLEIFLNKKCGHCREQSRLKLSCYDCTLNYNNLCDHLEAARDENGFHFLNRMATGENFRDKRKALRIAKRIYKAILKDDPRA